jgi:hypothetical protein
MGDVGPGARVVGDKESPDNESAPDGVGVPPSEPGAGGWGVSVPSDPGAGVAAGGVGHPAPPLGSGVGGVGPTGASSTQVPCAVFDCPSPQVYSATRFWLRPAQPTNVGISAAAVRVARRERNTKRARRRRLGERVAVVECIDMAVLCLFMREMTKARRRHDEDTALSVMRRVA